MKNFFFSQMCRRFS